MWKQVPTESPGKKKKLLNGGVFREWNDWFNEIPKYLWKSLDVYIGDVEIIGTDSGSGSQEFCYCDFFSNPRDGSVQNIWYFMAIFFWSPQKCHPPRNRALTRPNEGTMTMLVNSPLVRPYFFDGVASPWDMIDWSLQNDYVVGPVSSWICFFLVIFYGIYYHGQSPRNSPPFGRFLLLFPSICLSKTPRQEVSKIVNRESLTQSLGCCEDVLNTCKWGTGHPKHVQKNPLPRGFTFKKVTPATFGPPKKTIPSMYGTFINIWFIF